MAGNVWEWTCSINDKKNDAEQKCLDEEGFYGLRGGHGIQTNILFVLLVLEDLEIKLQNYMVRLVLEN